MHGSNTLINDHRTANGYVILPIESSTSMFFLSFIVINNHSHSKFLAHCSFFLVLSLFFLSFLFFL